MSTGRIARIPLLLIVFLGATLARPLPCSAIEPGDLSWRTIGKGEGFSGGEVTSIVQDARGLIWIGAAGGLYRYDGQDFVEYRPGPDESSLRSSSVSSIREDSEGRIWVGTLGGGLSCYDPARGGFVPLELAGEASSIVSVSDIAVGKDGRLLVGTADGKIFGIDPESGGPASLLFSSEYPVTCLSVDTRGTVWAGTDGGGLYSLGSGRRSTAGFSPVPTERRRVRAILEDSLGFLWVGYADGGVDMLQDGIFRHSSLPGVASGMPAVIAMMEDIKGQIWVSFEGGLLGILDPSDMEIDARLFAGGTEATALLRDRRGLLWVGLARGGLLTGNLRSANFKRTEGAGGASADAVDLLLERSDGVLLAVAGGSELYFRVGREGGFGTALRAPEDFGRVECAAETRDGTLWLGGSRGELLGYSGASTRRIRPGAENSPLSVSGMLCLSAGPDGRLWFGNLDTVGTYDPRSSRFERIPVAAEDRRSAIALSSVVAMAWDADGRLWLGSAVGGLSRYDPRTARLEIVRPAEGSKATGTIPDSRIESLFVDSRGLLWVGTGGSGLFALDTGSGSIVHEGGDFGLPAEAVFGVAEDASGRLWAAAASGLYTFDLDRRDSYLYGPEDGIGSGGLESGAILAAGDGTIWLGRGSGITSFDPLRVARYSNPPDVVISELTPTGGASLPSPSADGDGITLEHDNTGLSFSITVVDYAAPDRNRYAMLLEGRQAAWTSMGNNNQGYLAALQPGKYMLRVKGSNGNGVWNNYGASLSIVVRSPWWDAGWLKLLVFTVILAATGIVILARLEALRKRNALLSKFAVHIEEAREEERKIAARDVHDEIGQHLMVLNFHTYWLASHPRASQDERNPVIEEMRRAIQDAMASVKAIATRFRPEALDSLDFPDALAWYMRSFGKMSGVATDLKVDESWRSLPKPTARALFRLLQEMLSNVARHAEAGSVRVEFGKDGGDFVLRVEDDGKGMPPGRADAQDSFGIIGMQETCAGVGGFLAISSAKGKGCTVTARLPYKEAGT